MAELRHQVLIGCSPKQLYEALTSEDGIGSWWDKPNIVQEQGNIFLEFRPGEGHGVLKMKVLDQNPCSRVEWQCISAHEPSSPASAWTGTKLLFQISEAKDHSILNFTHSGWDETSKYFAFCNYQWGKALQSLEQYCG